MPKKTVPAGFVGFLYGGIIKHGYVRFFITSDDVTKVFDEFKKVYGNELRGRYVASELYESVLNNVRDKLLSNKFKNIGENIFEISIANSTNTLKEFAGVKKAKILGKSDADAEGSSDEKDPKLTDKKVTAISDSENDSSSDVESEVEAKPIKKGKKVAESDSEVETKPAKKGKKVVESDSEVEAKPTKPSKKGKKVVESDSEAEAKPTKKGKKVAESDSEVEAKPAKKKTSPKKAK